MLQHLAHFLVEHIHALQRPNHDLEMGDKAVIIAANHVDAIDGDTVDHGLEFQKGAVFAVPFADIGKFGIAERVASGGEIFGGDCLADLR